MYRTGNRGAKAGGPDDWTKYNPWRAPGTAPIFDPCGMAGGGPTFGSESGAYNTTKFAKQGDLGSNLPPAASGVVWKAGGLATTGWYIRANHGGGYQYRLCSRTEFEAAGSPKAREACFQRTPLWFSGRQWLKWNDGTQPTPTLTPRAPRPRGIPECIVATAAGERWGEPHLAEVWGR